MAKGSSKQRGPKPKETTKKVKKKVSILVAERVDYVDYKNTKLLLSFIPERAKILPRRMFGTCAPCQRKVRTAILRARQMALIPYSTE